MPPPFQRVPVTTPADALARLRELGMLADGPDGQPWWVTDAAYVIDAALVDRVFAAATGIQQRCYAAVEALVASGDYTYFGIANPAMQAAIAQSWRAKDSPLHGRMDFTFAPDGTPMLLDYEADSPFGLAEASYVQWEWFEAWQAASGAGKDSQENLIYEKLKAHLPRTGLPPRFAIACGGETAVNGDPADTGERFDAEYLAEIAREVGLRPGICSMEQLGWDLDAQCFVDAADEPLQAMIKIYPWDWMEDEPNVEVLPRSRTRILPGAWTRLVADKTMMALLWHMAPGTPNLLPTFLDRPAQPGGPLVAKPRRGWDGEHVYLPGQVPGEVPEAAMGPLLYQAHCPLPVFEAGRGGVHANLSVWMVGGEPAGIAFRESTGPVTGPAARFVPHILRG
jgi:glutathionylspermidine synthase